MTDKMDDIVNELGLIFELAETQEHDDFRHCESCNGELPFVNGRCARCIALEMMADGARAVHWVRRDWLGGC